ACPLALEMMRTFEELLTTLRIVPEAMRANLALSHGLINAENMMMVLARQGLGRQAAHDLVHEAVLATQRTGCTLGDVMNNDPRVQSRLTPEQVHSALDPENYLGDCVALARQQAQRAHAKALEIRTHHQTLAARH